MTLWLCLALILPEPAGSGLTVYQIPHGKGTLLLDLRIAPSSLIFVKKDTFFLAEFEVFFGFSGAKREEIGAEFRKYREERGTYEETVNDRTIIQRQISLEFPSGDVRALEVRVNDLHSERIALKKEIPLKRYEDPLSDLIPLEAGTFLEETKKQLQDRRNLKEGSLLLYFEGQKQGESPLTLEFEVVRAGKEKEKTALLKGEKKIFMSDTTFGDTFSIPLDSLESGKYRLEARFLQGDRVIRRNLIFSVFDLRRLSEKDYHGIIDILTYLTKPEELALLKAAPPEKRQALLEEFWAERDPTPGTPKNEFQEEYLERIAYANTHFPYGNWSGHQTDRGRIYIKYGAPDQIERFPFEFGTVPREVWYYYENNCTFVFVDRLGIGDYELSYPRDSRFCN